MEGMMILSFLPKADGSLSSGPALFLLTSNLRICGSRREIFDYGLIKSDPGTVETAFKLYSEQGKMFIVINTQAQEGGTQATKREICLGGFEMVGFV